MDERRHSPGAIRDKYTEATRHLRREQYQFNLNRAFLAGEQWLYWDSQRNTIGQLQRDPARTRVTMNRLWPASRHILSRVLSRPLVFEVNPGDSDSATILGAQTASSVLRDLHREHCWETLREEVAWNTWLGGSGIVGIDWDPTGDAVLGALPLSGKPFGTGDIQASALSINEVAWEPGLRDAERGYWWVRAQALPPSEVQLTYDMASVPQADAAANGTPLTQQLLREDRADSFTEMTLVLTYYERPNKSCPQGMVATVVGSEFVDGPKPWPFPWKDRLNLILFRETKVPGQATGDTVFSAAVPVQAAYNASWSNIIEHMKLAGNARLMVPDAALDGIDELTDLPGEILPYNSAAGAPSWLTPASMQPWVIEQPMRLAEQMDDILGIHDTTRGQAPTNIESGIGLSVLVEQDTTPLGSMTKELAYGFERLASLALRLYEAKVKDSRRATIQVEGQVPETVEWTGKALAGQTRASVPLDAVMPRSRAAQLAYARELWDRKIISTVREFARIADLPDQQDLLEGVAIDRAKAMSENHLMCIGEVQVPEDFDDHEAHRDEHNWLRKTKRYRSAPPEIRDLIDKHIEAHEVMHAEELGKQVARAAAHPALSAVATPEGTELPPGVMPGMAGMEAAAAQGQSSGANYAQPMSPIQPYDERGKPPGPLSGAQGGI